MKLEEDPASPQQCEGRSPLSRPKEYIRGGEGNRREAQKSREASVDDSKRGGGDGSVQALKMSIGFGDMLGPGSKQPHRQRMNT